MDKVSPDLADLQPNRVIKQTTFENAFRGKSMLKAELEEVQRIADNNSSGAVDSKEWAAFQKLFVQEFYNCDSNNDWKIDAREGPACFVEQQWWKDLNVSGDNSPEMASQAPHQGSTSKSSSFMDMLQAMDRNHDGDLNFAEQLFMRKMASAWRRCVTGWGMNWKELKCGLRVTSTIRGSAINDGDARKIALHAMTWMEISAKRISIPVFARIAQYYNMFQTQCHPVFDCRINKASLMRNIELQTVPNALTPLQAPFVNVFQKAFGTQSLSFEQFSAMMQWIEKFTAYAGSDSLLNADEFITILNDRTFNWKMRSTIDYSPADIDSKHYFKMPDMDSVPGIPRRTNTKTGSDADATPILEGDFFHTSSNFLQTNEDAYEGVNAPPVTDGPKSRKVIFNVLDVNMDGHLTLNEFFNMITMYNVYNQMAGDAQKQNPWSITLIDFHKNVKSIKKGAIIGFPTKNEEMLLDSLEGMLMIAEVNFKEFMIKFNFRKAYAPKEIANTMNAVTLVDLMSVLSRQDLHVENPKAFLSQCFTPNPTGGSAQNYLQAVNWALMMEQKAILNLNAEITKKEFNLDLTKFEKVDANLGGKEDEDK